MTQLTPARAVAMQKRGMTATAIGRELGVTPNQVAGWFRALGYDAGEYHGEAIARMYADGAAVSEIEQAVGVVLTSATYARERLDRILERYGLERRDPHELRYERERRADPLVCNRCTILLDAERESGMCTDCERELVSGRLAMAPTEFALMAEALEGVR